MRGGARISLDGRYRYWLTREWQEEDAMNPLVVIGLNPSTADETKDDPTIRRCIQFAKDWGHDSLTMLNLFAFRSTDPMALREAQDPVGPENDEFIRALCECSRVLAAWGVHGTLDGRDAVVRKMLREVRGARVQVLGLTKDGHPKHPLYIAAATQPEDWPCPA
jgi:hypothetical protein